MKPHFRVVVDRLHTLHGDTLAFCVNSQSFGAVIRKVTGKAGEYNILENDADLRKRFIEWAEKQ